MSTICLWNEYRFHMTCALYAITYIEYQFLISKQFTIYRRMNILFILNFLNTEL